MKGAEVAHELCVARCRSQHRDTPDNNANTPFEFTPENSKMARARGLPPCPRAPWSLAFQP
jgi:hypothetical protein